MPFCAPLNISWTTYSVMNIDVIQGGALVPLTKTTILDSTTKTTTATTSHGFHQNQPFPLSPPLALRSLCLHHCSSQCRTIADVGSRYHRVAHRDRLTDPLQIVLGILQGWKETGRYFYVAMGRIQATCRHLLRTVKCFESIAMAPKLHPTMLTSGLICSLGWARVRERMGSCRAGGGFD